MSQSELKSRLRVSRVRLLATALGLCVLALAGSAAPSSGEKGHSETVNASGRLNTLRLTPAAEVYRRLEMQRAAEAPLPIAVKQRLGVTHYGGKYSLTDEPYLLEGAKAVERLGFGVIKLWFNVRALNGYGYHSTWNLPRDAKMVDLAQHPYFLDCFRMPFSTFVLEATPFGTHGAQLWLEDDAFFAETEKQTYDLARYFLETFRDREVTFIIQNWEGDWMTRDPKPNGYSMVPASDWPRRFAALHRWFEARQNAVARARLDVPTSRARVLHAVEVNRVLESASRRSNPDDRAPAPPRRRSGFLVSLRRSRMMSCMLGGA